MFKTQSISSATDQQPDMLERAEVKKINDILGKSFPVLDRGFVRVIDYMGDDAAIVQAARVSYGQGTKSTRNDRGLIRYLMRHKHTSPFEMCEIKFHLKMPIFVARQWIRHRTANVNEYSARYSILDNEFYIPDPTPDTGGYENNQVTSFTSVKQYLAAQSKSNKQGREGALPGDQAQDVIHRLRQHSNASYDLYEWLLNEDDSGQPKDHGRTGIARELARMVIPTNVYTQMYWKIDLHNLLHLIRLRADEHAQEEIRAYAQIIQDIVRQWVPQTYDAFVDYIQDSYTFSGPEMNLLRDWIKTGTLPNDPKSYGLSDREWNAMLLSLSVKP